MSRDDAVTPREFGGDFQLELEDLIRWRRDVRRFRTDPVPDDLLHRLLSLADLSPSVGNSQPWRIVKVASPERRDAVRQNFETQNAQAGKYYQGQQAQAYARLKLAGLSEAPVHLAVFSEEAPEQGHGLGRATMPETLAYSTVGMIQTLWLAARSHGIGLGWVSILDAKAVTTTLEVPRHWRFIAYLCLGYPQEEHVDPELERHDWQERTDFARRMFER
ncbi:5,6-dimethylbenzimidazole synthase [Roseibium sp.]|uniref:5,6-dimethylbenzimidazole synthase n=1 Tax=Roseibium sp. TaxID=1936156 RepID=UPI003A984101